MLRVLRWAALLSALAATATSQSAVIGVSKRQRERNVGGFPRYAPREPSCEQLRAMWKLSRRQHRNAVLGNALPRYQEPFLLGRVHDTLRHNPLYAAPRPPPPPSYGTIVHAPGPAAARPRPAALKEIVRMMPPAPAAAGGGRPDNIRQLVQMFGRPGEPAPQGLTGQYGRLQLAPRPRKAEPAGSWLRPSLGMPQRSIPTAARGRGF